MRFNNRMGWNRDTKPELEVIDEHTRNTQLVLKNIDFIRRNLLQLHSLCKLYVKANDKKTESILLSDLNKTKDEVSKRLVAANKLLEKSDKRISAELEEFSEAEKPELRMYLTRVRSLQSKMFLLFNENNQLDMAIQDEIENKIYQQLLLYDDTIEREDVQDYMENPKKMTDLVAEKMYGKPGAKIDNAVNDLQEKLDEMNNIGKNVTKMVALLEELQHIVKSQSELIDSIDNTMANVKDYMASAADQLDSAKKEMSSAMEKFCCLFFICLIIMVFVMNYLMSSIGL